MKSYIEIFKEFIKTKDSTDLEGLKALVDAKMSAAKEQCGPTMFPTVKTLVFGVIKADGIVAPDELGFIRMFSERHNLDSQSIINDMNATTDDDVAKATAEFKKYPEAAKEDLIFFLIFMASIDGFVDAKESSVIKNLY